MDSLLHGSYFGYSILGRNTPPKWHLYSQHYSKVSESYYAFVSWAHVLGGTSKDVNSKFC